MSTLAIARVVLHLDWRLLVAAFQESPTDLALPAAIGAIMLATLCESALQAAALMAGVPAETGAALVTVYLWTTMMGTAALVVSIGELSIGGRVVAHLRLQSATRLQAFAALQAMSICGRHALAPVTVGLPLLCLLVAWLPPERLPVAIVAVLVTTRLIPGLLRGMAVVASRFRLRTVVALLGLMVAVVFVATLGTWAGEALAVLPPSFAARIVLGEPGVGPWLGLAGWTMLIGLFEFATLWREAQPAAPSSVARANPAIPWGIGVAARLFHTSPTLLNGEMKRLLRWRRFLMGWAVGVSVLVLLATRITSQSDRLLPVLVLALIPPFVAVATLGNLFAADRAAAQAYFLLPVRAERVIRAKCAAVSIWVCVVELLAGALLIGAAARPLQVADVYCVVVAAGFYVWIATVGLATSVLFPSPTDPQSVGGGLVGFAGAVVLMPGAGLFMAAAVAGAGLYDLHRIDLWGLAGIGGVLDSIAIVSAFLVFRVFGRVLQVRREAFLGALRIGTTLS